VLAPEYFARLLRALERAEVDGGLHLLRVARDVLRPDLRGDRGLARLRLERGDQALVRKERRVDPPRRC
jgi:hypothetical protein